MRTENPIVAALALMISLFVVVYFLGGLSMAICQTVGLAPFLLTLSWALTPCSDTSDIRSLLLLDKRISHVGFASILMLLPNMIAVTFATGIVWWIAIIGFSLFGYTTGCIAIAKIGIEKRLAQSKSTKSKPVTMDG